MQQTKLFFKRLYILLCMMGLFAASIVIRLFQLQITYSLEFFRKSQNNFMRFENILSPRGAILDIHGIPLATNRPIITVYWQGTGNKTLSNEQTSVISLLEAILEKPLEPLLQSLQSAEKRSRKIALTSDLSFDQLSRLLEQFPDHPNIAIETHFKRFYPYATLACHILGYITNLQQESTGKMGLEKKYEELLKGIPGKHVKTVNSTGNFIATKEVHRACAGKDLQTTIDLELQQIVEEVFPQDCRGSCIIMNPVDGDIYALLSRPVFDPNIFLSPLSEDTWQELQVTKPFLNRACVASYPPASLFKLVSLAAALENGLATEDSTWYCPGYSTFGGRRYHCNNHKGHGTVNTEQALAKSCNIPFYELGKRMKIDMLADYAHRFGLGEKTNITLPEDTGFVPTATWKRHAYKEPWWPGETLSAMIGQGFLLATPIQTVCMVAAICEGSLVTPRILIDEPIQRKPLNIHTSTRKFIKRSMKRVVKDGTGQRLNRLRNMRMYAKTGTAQVSSLDLRAKNNKYLEHAWFVSHFRYKDNQPLVIAVFVENVGLSVFATTIAKNFIVKYCAACDHTIKQ